MDQQLKLEAFDKILAAIREICRMGANPCTGYNCHSRKDFVRHVDRMWQIAFDVINDLNLPDGS